MHVTIRQKNLEITPALQKYIETKLLKPIRNLLKSKIAKDLPVLDLEFGRITRHHRKGKVYYAEASLSFGKKTLRAEINEEDIRAACDLLAKELEHEILNYKNRSRALQVRGGRRLKKEMRFDPAARLYRQGRIRDEGN